MFPTPGGIDIYLTNRIYDETWKFLVETWLRFEETTVELNSELPSSRTDKDGTDLEDTTIPPSTSKEESILGYDALGKYWRLWILKPDLHYGTVHLNIDSTRYQDSEHWQRFLPHQPKLKEAMEKSYQSNAIPTIPGDKVKYTWAHGVKKMEVEEIEKGEKQRTKRLRDQADLEWAEAEKHGENKKKKKEDEEKKKEDEEKKKEDEKEEKEKKGEEPQGSGGSTTVSTNAPNPGSKDSQASDGMITNLMADASLTSQPISVNTEPKVLPLRIPWAVLVKFGLAVGDLDLLPINLLVSALSPSADRVNILIT